MLFSLHTSTFQRRCESTSKAFEECFAAIPRLMISSVVHREKGRHESKERHGRVLNGNNSAVEVIRLENIFARVAILQCANRSLFAKPAQATETKRDGDGAFFRLCCLHWFCT